MTPSITTSFIGGLSLVIIGTPSAVASNRCRPRPSQRLGRQADVGGGEHPQVIVGRQIGGDQLDPPVATAEAAASADHPIDLLRLPVDLRLEPQPQPRVGGGPESLDGRARSACA